MKTFAYALICAAMLAAAVLLSGCDGDTRVPAQATTTTTSDDSSYGGFGMSYSGRAGVSIGNGLVITGKGLELGFGF
jgi:hypothetical protein